MQRTQARLLLVLCISIALLLNDAAYLPGMPIVAKLTGISVADAAVDTTSTLSTARKETVEETTILPLRNDTDTPGFTDIFSGDWFYDEASSLLSSGIIGGYKDGSFRPQRPVTRAEMASFLTRAKGLSPRGGESFTDVHGPDWFYGDIVAVCEAGLMSGTSPGSFSPNRVLTREQASAVMVRATGIESITDLKEQGLWLQGFKDRRTINSWAKPYVAAVVKYGLMTGYTNQEFKPAAPVSRAEICVLVWNVLYEEIKPLGSYPRYVAPYLLKPKIAGLSDNGALYGSECTITAEIDPESSTQELWVDGKLVQTQQTSNASSVTFKNLKFTSSRLYAGVISKDSSSSAYSGTLTLYHFNAPASFAGYKHAIVIDKSEYNLYWIIDNAVKKIYRIAIGKDGTPTPISQWIVGQKSYEDPKGVYGPRRLRLYILTDGTYKRTGYGIHGTNEPWVIGSKASHGCIRLKNADILELWPQVDVGDHVMTQQ